MVESSVSWNQQEEENSTLFPCLEILGGITSTVPKETKNVVIKRDIAQEKESLSVMFCGHVNTGKSTIIRQLM
jgi:ribosome biogenesis GTPase A